jgi:hypothetical protein
MTGAVAPEDERSTRSSSQDSGSTYRTEEYGTSSRSNDYDTSSRSHDYGSSSRSSGSGSRSSNGTSFSHSGSSSGSGNGSIDTDLSGDDIKLVRSSVVCTKPGHERAYEEHTETVSWETTLDAYAGVVVGRFLRQHAEFSDEDLRYLKPHIEVVERYPKEKEEEKIVIERERIIH